MVDDLFDLELGLKKLLETENVTGLANEAELIRRIVAVLPERLFELEIKLNRPLTVDTCSTWQMAPRYQPQPLRWTHNGLHDWMDGWGGSPEEAFLKVW